jgi:hypothetical protein
MTKATKKVIEKTLKHYDEMIEWAKEQEPKERPDDWEMYKKIGQDWFDDCCPLCKKFFGLTTAYGYTCGKCPLCAKYGRCGADNSTSAWKEMKSSGTWKTWIRHATRMKEQIESLLEEVKP